MTEGSRFHRVERLSDAALHLLGLALALAAVPALVLLCVLRRGDAASVTAVSIYGISLLAMLSCSAIYNITGPGPRTAIYKRMDHSAIYIKIAGSYTPLVMLTGAGGPALLAVLWIAALGGSSLKIAAPDRLRGFGIMLYVGMGWAGVFLGGELLAALDPSARVLVMSAGGLYTLGVPFFLWEGLPFHRPIWHAFVFTASGLLYAAMCFEVGRVIEVAPIALG